MSKFLFTILSITILYLPTVRSEPDSSTDVDNLDYAKDLCAGKSAIEESTAKKSCTINCFRADPVCSANGVTYSCGCPEPVCLGIRVVKLGACKGGSSGGSVPLPGQTLLLVHVVWLLVLGFSVRIGPF